MGFTKRKECLANELDERVVISVNHIELFT